MSAPSLGGWDRRRRALTWLNVLLQSLLVVALAVTASLIARKFARRHDVTSRGTYRLTATTEDLLRGLPSELHVWLNLSVYETSGDRSLGVAVQRTYELLEEFARRSPKVKMRLIGGEGPDAEFRRLWSTVAPATVYLAIDPGGQRWNKKTVEVYQLYKGNSATGELTQYRGEPVLAQAIRELGAGGKRIVYESEGHGEHLTADVRQLGVLRQLMQQNEGIEIRRLALGEGKGVPEDADTVMILGPQQAFARNELEALEAHLDRGGSVLIALRPRVRTGLEDWLPSQGALPGDNLVHDPRRSNPVGWSHLVVTDFNAAHEINAGMVNVRFMVPDTSTVDPVEHEGQGWRTVPLLKSGPESWAETGETGPGRRPQADPGERTGALPLAVAVERPAKNPRDPRRKSAKLIVWGSVGPFTNAVLNPGFFQEIQWQYVLNNFRWLIDRSLLEFEGQEVSVKPLEMSADALGRLRWVVHLGFPAFGILLGVVAWFVRRK
jgi:hypothetical protein